MANADVNITPADGQNNDDSSFLSSSCMEDSRDDITANIVSRARILVDCKEVPVLPASTSYTDDTDSSIHTVWLWLYL